MQNIVILNIHMHVYTFSVEYVHTYVRMYVCLFGMYACTFVQPYVCMYVCTGKGKS